MDRDSGRLRGFGFVTYTSNEEASGAIQALEVLDLHGRREKVNYATERSRGGGYDGGGGCYSGDGGRFGSYENSKDDNEDGDEYIDGLSEGSDRTDEEDDNGDFAKRT